MARRAHRSLRNTLLPLLGVVLIGAVGTYTLTRSRADALLSNNGPISYSYKQFINPNGTGKGVSSAAAYQTSYERTFSPTGKQFAYVDTKTQIADDESSDKLDTRYPLLAVANSDGTGVHVLLDEVSVQNNGGRLSWSPDGQWIAFGVGSGTAGKQTFTLGLVHPDGSGYHTVPGINLDSASGFFGLSFSTSDTLVYLKTDVLCTVQLDGSANTCHALSQQSQVTSYSDPQVSPDGTKVLMRVGEGNTRLSNGQLLQTYNAATVHIDGTQLVALTSLPVVTNEHTAHGNVVTPTWSPDGKLIAYGISGDATTNGLYISNRDGTGVKRIDATSAFGIAWQPIVVGEAAGALPKDAPVATCTINNLPPSLVYGSVLHLTATVTNKSSKTLNTPITLNTVISKNAKQTIDDNITPVVDVAPAASTTLDFPAFTVPYGTSPGDTFTPTLFADDPAISCSSVLALPLQAATH